MMTAGSDTLVVSPYLYDEKEQFSRTNPTPGPEWTPKLVREAGQNRSHWLSPVRRIEFKRYKQACEFEEWRKKHDNDEVRAWNQFRRIKAGVEQIQVVSILKYDEPSSSESNRIFFSGRAQRATEPKVHANSRARQKSASISAKSSKLEEKTIAIRSSLRVGALTPTKNRRVGSEQETKRAANSNGQRRGRKRKNGNREGKSDHDDDPLLCPALWGGEVASKKIVSKKGVNGEEKEGEPMSNNPLMVGTLAYSDRENIQALPPPTVLPTEGGVCLHGTLVRSMSEELSLDNTVVHRITGLWSMIGLSNILDEPHQCEQFEYEHKCSGDPAMCPLSGRYTGFFYVGDGPEEKTKVAEKYFTLTFLLNSDGYQNVEGRGSNAFGKFSITGLLVEDGTITLCKHWEIIELKASRKLANVKLSAIGDVANGSSSSTMLPDAWAGAVASVPQTEESSTKGFKKSALFVTSSSKLGQKTTRVTKAIEQRAIKNVFGNRSERQTRASTRASTKNLCVGLGEKHAPKLRKERAIDKTVANTEGRQRSILIGATGLGSSESSNDPLRIERATKPYEYEAAVLNTTWNALQVS